MINIVVLYINHGLDTTELVNGVWTSGFAQGRDMVNSNREIILREMAKETNTSAVDNITALMWD